MSWVLVLIWSSFVVKASSNYRVLEDTPDMSCLLATPEIEFGDIPNRVILDDSLLDTWQKARVGYVETLVELKYIGCIALSNISGINHVSVSTSLDVGQCYSACGDGYAIIGLTSSEGGSPCLCFGDDIKSRTDGLDDCKIKCGAFVCGSSGSVSLYEKVKVENVAGQESNRLESCLKISKDGYKWTECDEELCFTACFTGIDDESPSNLHFSHCSLSENWVLTWFGGVLECFAESKYPMTYQQSPSVEWEEQHWTGVIQTISIRKGRDVDSRRVKAVGYVKKSDDGYFLNFDDSFDMIDYSICVDETVSLSTDKPGTSQTRESSSTSPLTSITDTSAENFVTTTTTKIATAMPTENKHMTESMGSHEDDKTEKGSNVGLSIGIPVVALLLVGIGVVVCVLWNRKRKPLKEKETTSSLEDNVIYRNDNAMIARINNACEEVDKPSNVLKGQDDDKDSQQENGNSYFGPEKAKNGAEYSEVSKSLDKKTESNDNAYFVPEKEEKTPDPDNTGYGSLYLGSFNSEGASNVPGRHVYSTAGSANTVRNTNDEYDHIGWTSGRALIESNNYDTTFAQKQERNPDDNYYSRSHPGPLRSKGAHILSDGHVYNTAGSANTDGNTNDEYDHIGRTSGRALTESNLYDSTCVDRTTDEPYDSTLLNTSANRNKTEEIYDKANNAANNLYANIGDY